MASISPEDIPGEPASPRTATGHTIALGAPLAAAPGPYGRVVIAGASTALRRPTAPADGLLLTEGQAGGPFTTPLHLGSPASTFAFTTAYLGDVALVSPLGAQPWAQPRPGEGHRRRELGGLQLRVQRHHAGHFACRPRSSRQVRKVDRSAHGRARLPQRQARRLLAARLCLRPRAACQGRAACRPAARAGGDRSSPWRADRGSRQRR